MRSGKSIDKRSKIGRTMSIIWVLANMFGSHLPFSALCAFEASARHLSFTRAGLELCVTQSAVSHQVKTLEGMLKVKLFRRLPRGLALTDEGLALMPVLTETFGRIRTTLDQFADGRFQEAV